MLLSITFKRKLNLIAGLVVPQRHAPIIHPGDVLAVPLDDPIAGLEPHFRCGRIIKDASYHDTCLV